METHNFNKENRTLISSTRNSLEIQNISVTSHDLMKFNGFCVQNYYDKLLGVYVVT